MFERLTWRDEHGVAHAPIAIPCYIDIKGISADRLAAYEDSGLSPEQVQELVKVKADGRLVVLPVKVGDTVYKLTSDALSGIEETKINRIVIKKNKITFNADCINDDWGRAAWDIRVCDFGKTVFLTEMEAKEVLKCQK